MRQKIVWFVIGILVGSLFLVSGTPTLNIRSGISEGNNSPAIQEIQFRKIVLPNHTAFVIFGSPERPLTPQDIANRVQKALESLPTSGRYKVYALPLDISGTKIVGYSIKVSPEGRVNIKIQRITNDYSGSIAELHRKLEMWAKSPLKFGDDIRPFKEAGIPEDMEAKATTITGNDIIMATGTSEPYWHDFGPIEDETLSPPAGNVYVKVHYRALKNDPDPSREYFMVSGAVSSDGAYFKSEPGYSLYSLNPDYCCYRTKKGVITQYWNLEPSLNPQLGEIAPGSTQYGYKSIQVQLGAYGVGVSFNVEVPKYKMVPISDSSQELVKWYLYFDPNSDNAKYTFSTMAGSVASFDEAALHDGNWHKIVQVQYDVTFEASIPDYWYFDSKTVSVGWIWMIKVG